MLVLFTDFGLEGPYVGQMKAVIKREAPGVAVIDLFHDAPAHDPRAAAYLLAAYAGVFERGTVLLCVVDPGVGSDERAPVVLQIGGRWYVGPGNGLFDVAAAQAGGAKCWEIALPDGPVSASFHGRDIFAPAAARLARGEAPPGEARAWRSTRGWADDLAEVVYIDRFGNGITGLRAKGLGADARIAVGGQLLARAATFAAVAEGSAFWYENANGLAELAVSRGRADAALGLAVGTALTVED